jgi:hypothetical protein
LDFKFKNCSFLQELLIFFSFLIFFGIFEKLLYLILPLLDLFEVGIKFLNLRMCDFELLSLVQDLLEILLLFIRVIRWWRQVSLRAVLAFR